MAREYTTNGGLEQIGTGEQAGTWGDTTNTNMEIVDTLTNGVKSVSGEDMYQILTFDEYGNIVHGMVDTLESDERDLYQKQLKGK